MHSESTIVMPNKALALCTIFVVICSFSTNDVVIDERIITCRGLGKGQGILQGRTTFASTVQPLRTCLREVGRGMLIKALVALWIVGPLVCSFATNHAVVDASMIGYGGMRKGGRAYCKGKHCLPLPSNPYDRGCEMVNQCRGGIPKPAERKI
ncbi:hypothetical protein NL676_013252 [Syzygium grande]|nr:hypothetical protein NL676_013252 [Syzygium grande]